MNLEITIPIPHKATHPNKRVHWAVKAKHAKKQREDARMAALFAIRQGGGRYGNDFEPLNSASVKAVFYFRTKHSRDRDNLGSWLKNSIDGIADAGVVANDRAFSSPETSYSHDKANPRVVITITPI